MFSMPKFYCCLGIMILPYTSSDDYFLFRKYAHNFIHWDFSKVIGNIWILSIIPLKISFEILVSDSLFFFFSSSVEKITIELRILTCVVETNSTWTNFQTR